MLSARGWRRANFVSGICWRKHKRVGGLRWLMRHAPIEQLLFWLVRFSLEPDRFFLLTLSLFYSSEWTASPVVAAPSSVSTSSSTNPAKELLATLFKLNDDLASDMLTQLFAILSADSKSAASSEDVFNLLCVPAGMKYLIYYFLWFFLPDILSFSPDYVSSDRPLVVKPRVHAEKLLSSYDTKNPQVLFRFFILMTAFFHNIVLPLTLWPNTIDLIGNCAHCEYWDCLLVYPLTLICSVLG